MEGLGRFHDSGGRRTELVTNRIGDAGRNLINSSSGGAVRGIPGDEPAEILRVQKLRVLVVSST